MTSKPRKHNRRLIYVYKHFAEQGGSATKPGGIEEVGSIDDRFRRPILESTALTGTE